MSKVIGLDGKKYTLKLQQAEFDDINRSSLHLRCREILKKLYPYDNIFEEITLPGSNDLTVDFIIPLRKCIFECNGIQHYKFSKYFHKTLTDFQASVNRDRLKKEWADLNGYNLVILDGRQMDIWEKQIMNYFKGETDGY